MSDAAPMDDPVSERDFQRWELAVDQIMLRRRRYLAPLLEKKRFERAMQKPVPTALLVEIAEKSYLDEWVQLATIPREGTKTTSVKAARELCAVASVCLANNHPMPNVVRLHLAKALRAGAEGRYVDEALKLNTRAGVSKDAMDQTRHERIVVAFLFHLIHVHNLSVPDAKEHACKQFSLGTRIIEEYWARHRSSIEQGKFSLDEHLEIYRHLCAVK